MSTKASPKKEDTGEVSAKQLNMSEQIFKYCSIVIVGIAFYCMEGFLKFREDSIQKGIYVFSADSFIWFFAGVFGTIIFRYGFYYLIGNKFESLVSDKHQGKDREFKIYSLKKLAFDMIFYTSTTVVAYYNFKDEYWFPTWIGGSGQCFSINKAYPDWPTDLRKAMEIYFMIHLGVHAWSILELVTIKRNKERKYYEFLLHHCVATSLILYSLMCNLITIGINILIIHDSSDIFLSSSRFFLDTANMKKTVNKAIVGIAFVATTFMWIYNRIIVFPACFIRQSYLYIPTPQDSWYEIHFEFAYLVWMCGVLVMMHVFWVYFLIKFGVRAAKGKEMTNVYDAKLKK